MKIAEYRNLNIFLTVLFNFFNDNEIGSSTSPVDDYDELLEKILNAEFISCRCNRETEHYGIEFRLSHSIEKPEVYTLNFGEYGDDRSPGLLIDFGERDHTGFFTFRWNEGMLPFFLIDFMDESGMLVAENSDGAYEGHFSIDDFMDIYEFIAFLQSNSDLEINRL